MPTAAFEPAVHVGLGSAHPAFVVLHVFMIGVVLAIMTLQFDTKGTRYTILIAGLLLGAWTPFDTGYAMCHGGGFVALMLVSVTSALLASLIAGPSAAALRQKAPERTASTHEVNEPQGEGAA